MSKTKDKLIYNISVTALFTAIIAICSWISVPIGPVPFTMQTFAVFCTAGILGFKRGFFATAVYILLGAVGVPVFHGFTGGIGIILGATGGYIVGFIATAAIVGLIADKIGRKFFWLVLGMVLGLAACYTFGTAWYMAVYAAKSCGVGIATALVKCVVPFLIPDAAKIALAAVAVTNVCRIIKV